MSDFLSKVKFLFSAKSSNRLGCTVVKLFLSVVKGRLEDTLWVFEVYFLD